MTRKPRHKRSAAHLVEFALMAPVLFLLLLGILEFGRLLFTWQLIHNAAREGARYAVVSIDTASTAEVRTYVEKYLAGQGATQFANYDPATHIKIFKADATGADSGSAWTDCGWGDYIGVTVSGTYTPIVPGFLSLTGSFTITGSCVMTTEAN